MAPGGFPFGRFLVPLAEAFKGKFPSSRGQASLLTRASVRPHEGRRPSSREQASVLTRTGLSINSYRNRKHLHPTKVKAKNVH